MADDKTLTAYQIHPHTNVPLAPAPIDRAWMDNAHLRHPYRCLPLNIANQNGWVMLNPVPFQVYWYGGAHLKDLEVRFDGPSDPAITSHFGNGVLTFSIPYLFRTPENVNLWVKGPSNWPKDGIQALEGVVETDWAASTFTMNWKVTRPFEWIRFEVGEPFCMVVPIARGYIETLTPQVVLLDKNPELKEQYQKWEASRRGFLQGLKDNDPTAVKQGWQKDYFQGKTAQGGTFDGHQTRLGLKEFDRQTG